MRYTLLMAMIVFFFAGCKKDKFTTAPQITFKSVSPDTWVRGTVADEFFPVLTINVTDAEGDLGFIAGSDTSFVYITNLRTNKFDSLRLPNISQVAGKNFQGDVAINMKNFLSVPDFTKKDTIYFNVYIKDFAKNKSNVILTGKPVYYYP
jgi:hypothetical protein